VTVHIGTSGWSYEHWCDVLYPSGAPLGYYAQSFETVELNSSFYPWPKLATFRRWRRRLPAGFQFSVKAPRGLTHAKKLYAPETWVQRIAACWHELGERAVLLVQLAPDHARDDRRLGYFLDRLPAWMRASVEFRHPSWNDEHVFAMLEHHQVAYCVMSGARLPCVLRATPSRCTRRQISCSPFSASTYASSPRQRRARRRRRHRCSRSRRWRKRSATCRVLRAR
jgi:uncharacterized protein YecE (DUF72 family)